jgi:hypothetical protein
MSYDKTMEELLVSARSLPTELSFDEVEFLFLNPTPPPPPPPWWQRGSYLKFLLMFTLLISLLGFLLPTTAESSKYQLSTFPVQEETLIATPVDELSTFSYVPRLEVPDINFTVPSVLPRAPKPLFAPAAAPEIAEDQEPEIFYLDEKGNLHDAEPAQTQMPPALFRGAYSPNKTSLMLTFQEIPEATEDAPLNILILDLTKDEQRDLKQNKASLVTIERAAGNLLLYPNRRGGTFEFLPNTSYQDDFSAKGWGPTGVSEQDGFFQVTIGKSNKDSEEKRVEDQLWFRYFTANINEDYLNLLRTYGYDDTDFGQLWKLANSNTDYQKLEETLTLSSAALTGSVPLAELPSLENDLNKLKDLRCSGEPMSFAQFDAMKAEPSIWELLAKAQNPSVSIPAVDKYEAMRERELDLNFSIDRPGTLSDTIAYDGKQQLKLIGNFDFRINKDTTQQDIIVYGSEKFVNRLRRKSGYEGIRLVHKNKKQPLFIEFPRGINLLHRSERGVTMEVTPTKPRRSEN